MTRLINSVLLTYLGIIVVACSYAKSSESKTEEGDQANTSNRPNILIAISDDQSYPHTGIYGDEMVETPAFDRLASEGILFHNAFAAAPGCAPSRTSIHTGRFQWQNEEAGGHWTVYPEEYIPFPDLLEESGYHVGFTGKGVAPFNWERSGRERNAAGNEYADITYTREQRRHELPARGFSGVNYAANFEVFLEDRADNDQPFYFWYGSSEPHRAYEEGSGLRAGKKLEDVQVPGFYPDHEIIRSDMLDYALEVDWFEKHLLSMVNKLEEIGELDNTLIIVTSDQGMPFPRAKTNLYDYGLRVPFAVFWPEKIESGRIVNDLISLAEIAPTVLEVAGVEPDGMKPMSTKSFADILFTQESGIIDETRTAVYAGMERHSSARWANLGYPKRSVRTQDFLYIRNFKPERWPAGAPLRIDPDTHLELDYMHGLNENGEFSGEAYYDIDDSPTKTFLIENMDDPGIRPYYELAMAKRPAEELYDVRNDPYNMNNLADDPEYTETLKTMRTKLFDKLTETEDPRVVGPVPDIFDNYQRYGRMRGFPTPDWIIE